VVAPDLPGFGASGRHEREAYDYAAQVERLRAFLDALGIPRAHLAGSSMGGTLAVLFALQHPDRVASVALVGSPHGIRTPRASDMDRLVDGGAAPLVARTREDFQRMTSLVFARRPWLPYPVWHAAEARALRDAPSNLRIWKEQLKDRWLLDARIAALRHPTLVLWGGADRVFDASGADVVRPRVPHALVRVLPQLGHLPMMEAPAPTAGAYRSFLETAAAVTPPALPAAAAHSR
jgi:pimeloyl-ACP methyl ester carboxylesterase